MRNMVNRKTLEQIKTMHELYKIHGRMTLRMCFYRMISMGINIKYDAVGRRKQAGIAEGLLTPDMFADRSRPSYGTTVWKSCKELILYYGEHFKLDYWNDEPHKVEVWTEKDALSQILLEEANKYRVPVRVTRGYNSDTMDYEWGADNKIILYFGDFDPSGVDMDNKIAKVKSHACYRVALTYEQAQELQLQSVDIKDSDWAEREGKKKGDPRAEGYKKLYGDQCWELDAMEPQDLRKLVRDSIEKFVNFDLGEKMVVELGERYKFIEWSKRLPD